MPESAQPNYNNLMMSIRDYDKIVQPKEQSGHSDPDKAARQDIMAIEKAWDDSKGNVVKTALSIDKDYAQTAHILSNKAIGIISKDDPRTMTASLKPSPMPEYVSAPLLMDLEGKAMRTIENGEKEKGMSLLSQVSQGTNKLIHERTLSRQVQSEAESSAPPQSASKDAVIAQPKKPLSDQER